ncbi:MAG TPA: PEP-CTERM sorting domain-containing protein [Tepidisphaeraceae bacterium]
MRRMRFGRSLIATVVAGMGFAGLAKADVVTFDNTSDLGNNFSINVQSGTTATPGYPGFIAVSSGGIGNSGAVDVTAGPSGTLDATGVYTPKSFNPQNGTITVSQYVKVQATTTGDRLLHLGIIDDPGATHQLNGGGAARADFISARLFPTVATVAGAATSPFTYQVQSGNSVDSPSTATATTNNTQTANFDLTIGDWYLFTMNVNRLATANTFSVDSKLQDFGTDGLTPGATMTFAAQTIAANTTDIYNDTSVYGAFRSHATNGGADLLDTFSVSQTVPEPATLGVIGLGAAGLLGRRRNKR